MIRWVQRKGIVIGVFAGVLAIAAVVWLWPNRSVHLPDGTYLRVERVASGNTPFYESATLRHIVPPRMLTNVFRYFGIPSSGGIVVPPPVPNALTVWMRVLHPGMSKTELAAQWDGSKQRIVVVDAKGMEWGNAYFSLQSYQLESALIIVPLAAYPRTEEKFRLRISREVETNRWMNIAEFPIHNERPVKTVPRSWTVDPLPLTNHLRGLEVILDDVRLSKTDGGSSSAVSMSLRLWNEPVRVRWRILSGSIEDRFGNSQKVNGGRIDQGRMILGSRYGLDPGEIWKIVLQLERQTNAFRGPKDYKRMWMNDFNGKLEFFVRPRVVESAAVF